MVHDPLDPADLERRAREVAARALAVGALQPIPTRVEVVEQAGLRFQVRVLDTLWRKEHATAEQPADPFGPCDPDLLIGDLGPRHRCVLNKFPALAGHLLIVTRDWEEQERLLTAADFAAVAACLTARDALVFYNGGLAAGASQAHKHLQVVPLPLVEGEPSLPVAPAVVGGCACFGGARVRGLPFVHALALRSAGLWDDPAAAAAWARATYHRLLAAVGLACGPGCCVQPGPYNLLLTRTWMLLIPRRRERWQGASVNALGFAGCLLARDDAELARMRAAGPLAVLRAVAHPADP
jgi:ATP adenylyltransferase